MNDRPASPRGLGRTVPVHAGALQRENARKYLSAGAKSGSLSARPSTAFTRVAAAPARRPVTGGDSPRGAAAQTEPELLHKLVQFVRTELTKLGSPGIDERLEVFRRAFHHFISTFGAYAPFLLAVGRAYDDALEKARGTGADVHDLSSRLATMQSESAQLLGDWRRQAEREKAALLAQGKESERAQAESGRQARKLDLELATTRQELVHLQRQHADAEARIAELMARLEDAQGEAAEYRQWSRGDGMPLALGGGSAHPGSHAPAAAGGPMIRSRRVPVPGAAKEGAR